MNQKLLVWFDEVDREDISLVGGKGANLGEMTKAGFPVPPGFIVTSVAYRHFLKENNLETKIRNLLAPIDYTNQKSLEKASKAIKKEIQKNRLSEELVKEIFDAYLRLSGPLKNALVAVRSSATAEDLQDASFAGQQETYLNVKGEANLLLRIKEAWASLFDARALFYRHEHKISESKVAIAVPVEKMIESEASGVMFSVDPLTNDKSKIVIEAVYGLGEYIVQGIITPDHYEVDKASLALLNKKVVEQDSLLIKKGQGNKETAVARDKRSKQKITDKQILALAELSKKLEKHYYFPQDSEWAIEKGTIYLVQTRPVTTINSQSPDSKSQKTFSVEAAKLEVLLKGDPASPGIASGPVILLDSARDSDKVKPGDILVTQQTNPDFVSAMKKAAAIVTDSGGRTSHAAIVSRELGIPAVVGTEHATKILKKDVVVTVNGTTGEIFAGSSSVATNTLPRQHFPALHTATRVYVNLAQPDIAQRVAHQHVDGVGLLRAEFMVANMGVHPKEMLRRGKRKEFVEKLAQKIEEFCRAFSPRPVVYRATDFKTNEYRQLSGGKEYEPVEPNPMLGFRGAYRYIHDPEIFEMELDAIKLVRNKAGFKNLWLMLPFVRTVKELEDVKKIISNAALYRSPSFKLWMMVEIPSNVILLDKFIEAGIDGISIGSNDLTMLLLGTDRDNSEVSSEFSEQDPAVLWAFEHIIKTAHKHGITSSICGQAPSQHPSLLEKLVEWGITSISVSPDVINSTRHEIARIEKKLTHV